MHRRQLFTSYKQSLFYYGRTDN